jgi:LPPG:FO 2-phospho-L-lactate transferase
MSNDAVATVVRTDEGDLPFQHYFVARQCEPRVREIIFQGSDAAAPAAGVLDSIGAAETILIAPSNPYLSIDPILSVPGVRAALVAASAPIIAVSPLIKGKAIKGPTAKMMAELGSPVDNYAIACHYKGLIDGLVINSGDVVPEGIATAHTDTLMRSNTDKVRVAEVALALARDVAR